MGIWINSSACGGPAQSTVRLVNFIDSRHGIRVVMHPGKQKKHQDSPWTNKFFPKKMTTQNVPLQNCHTLNRPFGFLTRQVMCLKRMEKEKPVRPNDVLMVIYHGTKQKITLNYSKLHSSKNEPFFPVQSAHANMHPNNGTCLREPQFIAFKQFISRPGTLKLSLWRLPSQIHGESQKHASIKPFSYRSSSVCLFYRFKGPLLSFFHMSALPVG